ncbi:transposase [Arthrobacter sp. Ld5]|uniref:transposase n=1 Tax=Arthrobacter sp. Ld5 TaxID=649152 RepID=UPI003EBF9DDB
MDLAERSAALYVLPLDRFTQARNAAAKDAAKDGDRDLAAALRALPKPSSAAWLVNVLVDRRRGEVEQVLELAASLREAQASLDRAQVHALGQRRQRLLADVARQALDAAAEAGHDVGPAALPGVEQTLRAALADPAAAAAVLTGRLVRTLEASGWDPVDLDGAVAGPFTPPTTAADATSGPASGTASGSAEDGEQQRPTRRKVSARRRREAEAQLAAAREAVAGARERLAAAAKASARIDVRRNGVTASIEDLEDRLGTLRRELADVDEERSALAHETETAERSVEEAEGAEAAARALLEG